MTVTLKTVTPMFLGGANPNDTAELRAPSIKGALRFWYRAMHGHLPIEELRERESKLFGSSDEKIGRSKFSLFVQAESDNIFTEANPLPHHTGDNNCEYLNKTPSCNKNGKCSKGFPRKAIAPNKTFECIIRVDKNEIERVQNIFKASLILGGFGKRSRRGFGSVEITKINDNNYAPDYTLAGICKILNSIVPDKFKVLSDKIVSKNNTTNDYPYIEEIQIGQGCENDKELLKVIGRSSHTNDCKYTGFIDPYRFASPIYVSIIKDIKDKQCYKPIITRLRTAPKNSINASGTDKSKQFISDILNNAGGCK